jgi:DNA invertase Pin-like site-specific DNA recombinase
VPSVSDRSRLPIDGVIRVSRTAERDTTSDRYHTAPYQREQIEKVLRDRGRELGEIFEEENVSGKTLERDAIKQVMARFKAGETGGVAVAYLSRFGRSAGQTILAINEITQAGGEFITADGRFDTTTPEGKAFVGFMAILAEMELDRISENWETIIGRSVAQGRYIGGAIPTGFLRGDDGRLIPDEKVAPVLAELFRLRAEDGWSWTQLADWLTEQGVRPNTATMTERKVANRPARAERYGEDGWQRWTRQAVKGLIENPVYMGVVRQAGDPRNVEKGRTRKTYSFRNEEAHEAIVDRLLWEAANTKQARAGRNNTIAEQTLLRSLCFCHGCGHRMIITGRLNRRTGEREALYYCRRIYSTGECPAPASIIARKLDPFVEQLFLEHIAHLVQAKRVASADKGRLEEVERAVALAQADYDKWEEMSDRLGEKISEDRWLAGLEKRAAKLDAAVQQRELELERQRFTDEVVSDTLLQAWPTLPKDDKRFTLGYAIDRVIVRNANGKRGHSAPAVQERARIFWAGEYDPDVPVFPEPVSLKLEPVGR